jgi:polyhydroxyalkanoate synthesis regulator phasin
VAKLKIAAPKIWLDMTDLAKARHIHKVSETVDELTSRIEQLEKTVRELQRKLKV